MIFATTTLIGLTSALLRSAFAVIMVAAMIGLVFLAAFILFGTGFMGLVLSIVGFNAGLILFAAAHIIRSMLTTN